MKDSNNYQQGRGRIRSAGMLMLLALLESSGAFAEEALVAVATNFAEVMAQLKTRFEGSPCCGFFPEESLNSSLPVAS